MYTTQIKASLPNWIELVCFKFLQKYICTQYYYYIVQVTWIERESSINHHRQAMKIICLIWGQIYMCTYLTCQKQTREKLEDKHHSERQCSRWERGLGSITLQGQLHNSTNLQKIHNGLMQALGSWPFEFLVDTLPHKCIWNLERQ